MKTRALSAIVAVLTLVAVCLFFKTKGIYFLSCLIALTCLFEYSNLAFRSNSRLVMKIGFFLISAFVFLAMIEYERVALYACALGSVVFLAVSLWTAKSSDDLPGILQMQSATIMGLLYAAVFPAHAVKLLHLDKGLFWYFGLLSIVFAGDTFAYLAGRWWGRHKLLSAVSPKKTVEGALGGLLGSAVAGGVLSYFSENSISTSQFMYLAVVTGVFAQVGDLFESLLKRLADVKDSGSIMPGHGGMLDRVDGIYFAAPIYYVLVLFLTNEHIF